MRGGTAEPDAKSEDSDSLYVSKVRLKSAFPPRWGLLVKTSCPHSTACLHHAQPRGTTHPAHPAPAGKAHSQQEAGPTLEALGTTVHSGLLWPAVSTGPYSKDARPSPPPQRGFFPATSGPWLRCPLLSSNAASRRCRRLTGVLACDIEQSPTRGHGLSAWYSAQRPVVLGSWHVTRLGVFTPGSRLPVCPATGNKAKSASPQRSGQGITLRGAESSTPLTVSPLPPGPRGASGGRILLPPRRTAPVDDWPQQVH